MDLESGHTVHHRISIIDLYLHTKFFINQKNFLWVDIRIGGRTGIETALLGRLRQMNRQQHTYRQQRPIKPAHHHLTHQLIQ